MGIMDILNGILQYFKCLNWNLHKSDFIRVYHKTMYFTTKIP